MITKKDEYTILVTKTETTEVKREYDYKFLLEQKQRVIEQKTNEIAQRDAEIAELDDLITQADLLGVVEKVEAKEVMVEKNS